MNNMHKQIIFKQFFLFLVLISIVFSNSPEWVKEGLKVEYQILTYNKDNPSSISSVSSVSFTVVSKIGQEIKVESRVPATTTKPTCKQSDNTSSNSGTACNGFWYEPSLLLNAYIGQNIDGWLISKTGEKINLAEKDWNVVYMTKTVGGFTKYRIVDKEKGLLLVENVTASNIVYDTRFSSITPSFESATPPPPPATQLPPTPPPATAPPPTAPPPATPGEIPAPPPATTPPATLPPPASAPTAPAGSLQPPDSNIPCCPLAFIFLALGGFVYYQKKM